MATSGETRRPIPITSHETALCIIPSIEKCDDIDRLRELYDKAHGKWPPHINLIYPFVAPEKLPQAQEQIQNHLTEHLTTNEELLINLNQAGFFKQRGSSTIFLHENRDSRDGPLDLLRSLALQALGQRASPCNFHLTIGQSEGSSESSREYLIDKARLLPALELTIGTLAILIRQRSAGSSSSAQGMSLWGTIDVPGASNSWKPHATDYWLSQPISTTSAVDLKNGESTEIYQTSSKAIGSEGQPGKTYHFDADSNRWLLVAQTTPIDDSPVTMGVSSYNVLIDSEYPPTKDRDPHLITTILSNAAMADILVLQEVSDDFLSYLLSHNDVRQHYPFTSHGPPDQSDVGPLPSLRNIVILSKWTFSWTFVPFQRKHKGALVAKFEAICGFRQKPLIVAGVHLTSGLTDGTVAAKELQLRSLLDHLSKNHAEDPWVVAGDLNIPTSSHTIDMSIKDRSISNQTVATLGSLETMFHDMGLMDTWSAARIGGTDETIASEEEDLFEGEEGATFDPRNNTLAAATCGTSRSRPQRYDRILLRSQNVLHVGGFNHFGLPEDVDGVQVIASDHYGVRALMRFEDMKTENQGQNDTLDSFPVEHKRAIEGMADFTAIVSTLKEHNMFPSDEEVSLRQSALSLLKQVLLETTDDRVSTTAAIPMVIVPVGSYALGVWTSNSDIDCLCIGSISSKTFFKLARQRLLKAESQGVRILRKVEAATGTMLELSVNGITMDLQYCPAARIVERWSEFHTLPSSDPVFNLSILSLRKLKAYRDLLYLQRTLPSLSAFRLAYRCIKLWSMQRGIYSARFGYLGGVHITLMLSWVCKRLAYKSSSVTATDLVSSFFHHYAHFDWANDMVFDAFFHKKQPRYHRSQREPVVVLGFHAPNANIAHTATLPTLQTLVKEFQGADQQLSEPGMTWQKFLTAENGSSNAGDHGAIRFLQAYDTYVKVDIQFWGRTLAKGKGLVGWVEARSLSLIVDIHKALQEVQVRIWPARFTDSDPQAFAGSIDYHGCYLIGLQRSTDAAVLSKEERQQSKQNLEKVLDRFVTQLKTDEKNYDTDTCWISASLVRPSEVKAMHLDTREWGEYAAELDSDSDDEEDLDDLSDEASKSFTQNKRLPRLKPTSTSMPVSSSRLRPASDVLNRLRWDPNLDPSEYIIGYEDRFLGPKEIGLWKWKTEQTDEEFIPQHRILYFKKRSGDDLQGDVIWERATRVDKVFGSGVGAGIERAS